MGEMQALGAAAPAGRFIGQLSSQSLAGAGRGRSGALRSERCVRLRQLVRTVFMDEKTAFPPNGPVQRDTSRERELCGSRIHTTPWALGRACFWN